MYRGVESLQITDNSFITFLSDLFHLAFPVLHHDFSFVLYFFRFGRVFFWYHVSVQYNQPAMKMNIETFLQNDHAV